jgi:Uma2 family endonuclease
MSATLVLDNIVSRQVIRDRKERGIDGPDEVWDGVYVMSPEASLDHQDLAGQFIAILSEVVKKRGFGRVQPGANVSDRRTNWKRNYRVPDIVVVLKDGRAVDCNTHWFGGPDFLIEIESPDDDIDKKLAFYSKIAVRELLIIDRDTRALRLFRYSIKEMSLVAQSGPVRAGWIFSTVLPLAFRWRSNRPKPRIHIKRTDGKSGHWVV